MDFRREIAGCLWLFLHILPALGMVVIPLEPPTHQLEIDINQINWTNVDDSLDPSSYLAVVHDPTDEESTIHHISKNLLDVTKDLVSFAPRSPGADVGVYEKLLALQNLELDDVNDLLSYKALAVPEIRKLTCGRGTEYYRTMDGSCNNAQNPCWGKAEEPYRRWLPPAYANGIDEPRKRIDGSPLPSPRQVYQWVSSQFDQSQATAHEYMTNLVMVWGQMVAHDLVLTPSVTVKVWNGREFKDEKPNCCDTPSPHPECIPILLNYEDAFYTRGHCMNIARSIAYTYSPFSCSKLKIGMPREQMNQITTFLDASLVYGSSNEQMRLLRENGGLGAKMILDYSSGWSKPERKNSSSCKAWNNFCDKRCFLTGEKRANENPILASFHTLWVREHNRIVDVLRARGWPEETLFHVVRKIIGALLQHITYKEYLPLIVGPTLGNLMDLKVPSTNYRYNPAVNPSAFNAFATAAFRYGHSMISSQTKRHGQSARGSPFLSQEFFSMDDFCNPAADPIASLLSAQLDQTVQKVDCIFSKQVTNHLFSKEINGKGLDLFSLNIQRGRDHGIPAYNKWRVACGLPKANDYSDLKGSLPDYVIERLETVYGPGQVDEIDLFVGGVSELPVNDGLLGPTFTCIVANQFKNLKFGDRFWYENTEHAGAFTKEQLYSIQKTTLASLLCRNSDLTEMQQMAFIIPSLQNPKLSCKEIVQRTDLDLNMWP